MTSPPSSSKLKRGFVFLFGLHSTEPDQRSRELILRVLYLGTLGISFVALTSISVNYFVLNMHYLVLRVIIVGITTIFMTALYVATLRQHYTLASYALLIFYFAGATATV